MTSSAMPYYSNCVSWPAEDVTAEGGLSDMISQRVEITRRTFLKHVNRDDLTEIEDSLGYARHPRKGLCMAGDFHVNYYKSRLHDRPCVYFTHSAIEHVFAPGARTLSP